MCCARDYLTKITTAGGEIITKITTSSGEIKTEMKTAVDSAAEQIITHIICAASETTQGGLKAIHDNISVQLDQRLGVINNQLQTLCKRTRESEFQGDPGANKRSRLSGEIKCDVCGEGSVVEQRGLITSILQCGSCDVWKHLSCVTQTGDEPKEPYTCCDCRDKEPQQHMCGGCKKGDIVGVFWTTCDTCGDCLHGTCAKASLTDTEKTYHTGDFICQACRKTKCLEDAN